MNKPLIVFKLEYFSTTGWSAISNFITRFSEKLPMELFDVEIASSIVLNERQPYENYSLIKRIDSKNTSFKKIKKPENIYVRNENYNFAFFISIDFEQLSDVVNLLNLYLIYDACRQYRIIALISGVQSEYHKTSQFFTFLTEDKGQVYEKIFFKCDSIKHLQVSGIGVLSKFLPLVPIDASENIRMRQRVKEVVSVEIIIGFLEGKDTGENVPRIAAGALKQLSKHHKKFENCDREQCAVYLGDLNILSFLLFCFSLERKGKGDCFADSVEFNIELRKIAYCSDGCIQLLENIVFHSKNKRGAFSFRILDGERAYIKQKYSLSDTHEKWIEMMIVDYAGCSRTLNIAEKFQENLSNPRAKAAFTELTPRDFFAVSANTNVSDAWKQYYSEKVNLVHHYGLKIFQNIVQNSGGHFIAQSFSTHHPQEKEFYYDTEIPSGNRPTTGLPGTSYSVLFPIGQNNIKNTFNDYGIEYFEGKLDTQDILFDYRVINKAMPMIGKSASPQEKMERIRQIAEDLLDVKDIHTPDIYKEDRFIITINAAQLHGDMAEIIYKAVLSALLQCEYILHIVMFECQKEFVQIFLDAAYLGCINLNGDPRYKGERQIVLYTAEYYEEIIIMPEDWERTRLINRSNHFSRETRWMDYFEERPATSDSGKDSLGKALKRYPFDIIAGEDLGDTVFEKYVEMVINRNIQGQELGCKIEDTHMRLGSTIHVNHFYEAEILFGNSLFVERFALLIIKRMLDSSKKDHTPLNASDRITLYGYTNYSEQTVFCTMQFLRKVLPGIDVDYAILERESEGRGFTHVDRIRYSTYFESGEAGAEKRREHFRSRKITCIIPIASTLKTNEKMINLFQEENGNSHKLIFWRNFELILVGSTGENKYWEKDGKRIIGRKGMEISPTPEFFVGVTLDYMEPLDCTLCFPQDIIDEQPLIEVNAASTIPNQAFGLFVEEREKCKISEEELRSEEQKLEVLQDLLLYRHLERNENHFLFYFQTERLIVQYAEEVRNWLTGIKEKIKVNANDYIILFCPAHFSNTGFIEYVNSCVFGSAAMIIRDDVNKEYRCNFSAKFSNLRNFVEKMKRYNENVSCKRQLRMFFVDDAIITGHTFQRAKSLAQSIMKDYCLMDNGQKYVVFEGIFVLIDRNSSSSKWQYTGINEEGHLYAFRTIKISSIRNHGDACVYCNLAKEAETLKRSSVTKGMGEYWRSEEEKFAVVPLGVYLRNREMIEKKEKPRSERPAKNARAFRRLVCTNNAMI